MAVFLVMLGLVALLLAVEGAKRLFSLFIGRRSQSLPALPFPPGPKPLPFIGNVLDMNKGVPHLMYTEWAKTYGDIVYTRVCSQEIIILNSEEVAIELFEKRSQKYSDRPRFSIADMFDFAWPTPAARYGPRFRLHRRLLHQFFHANASLTYRPRQLQKAYDLLTRLLDDPTHYANHFTTLSAAVVMEVTYGCDIQGKETFVTSMQRAADIFLRAATPQMSALCDVFPFVKVFPAWLPGMGFKSEASECRRLVPDAVNGPYAWVAQHVEDGTAAPSLVAHAITRYRQNDGTMDMEIVQAIKDAAGSLYEASAETTNATLIVFVHLMMNHPEVQRRAQEEIDRVVGRQRLPDFDDRGSLPYVDAILRETLRWHPVAPIGVPHATSEDDVYRGYYIPQGATVFGNIWAMTRNESKYPDPEKFMPERFFCADGVLNDDVISWAFGFGRRICPGRHVADASLWSAIVCMLALFKIEKTEGSDSIEWATGLTSHLLPFPCKFVPRDEGMDLERLSSLIGASRVDL